MNKPDSRIKDVDMFRFEPQLPSMLRRPSANDSSAHMPDGTAPGAKTDTLEEKVARANKTVIDLVGGLSMQFWALVFICNPQLAIISSMMRRAKQ